ncbi:MAG TPA: hypothetical protein PJ990_20650, partial [Saprospiraceae bacterium]|nr:hypothetical protein [Saprospiraceae bacterium]
DFVDFDIYVYNQGDIAADNITITDYIPSCFTLADPNWVNNGNGTASRVLSAANGDINLPLMPETSVIIPIRLRVGTSCVEGSTVDNYAEISAATNTDGIPQEDVDSNFDANNGNDGPITDNEINENGKEGMDEDDHDIASLVIMTEPVEIFDLALTKKFKAGQSSPLPQNATVTFDITVYNQGNVPADNIAVIDYLPTCATLDDPAWTNNGNGTASIILSVENGRLPIALLTGQSVTVPITMSLNGCTLGNYANWAEISGATNDQGDPVTDIDSDPDNIRTNDTYTTNDDINSDGKEGGDEDDHDPEFFTITPIVDPEFDLALTKTFAPGQSTRVEDGSVVVFNINVYNQGNVSA